MYEKDLLFSYSTYGLTIFGPSTHEIGMIRDLWMHKT